MVGFTSDATATMVGKKWSSDKIKKNNDDIIMKLYCLQNKKHPIINKDLLCDLQSHFCRFQSEPWNNRRT